MSDGGTCRSGSNSLREVDPLGKQVKRSPLHLLEYHFRLSMEALQKLGHPFPERLEYFLLVEQGNDQRQQLRLGPRTQQRLGHASIVPPAGQRVKWEGGPLMPRPARN